MSSRDMMSNMKEWRVYYRVKDGIDDWVRVTARDAEDARKVFLRDWCSPSERSTAKIISIKQFNLKDVFKPRTKLR